MDSLEGLITPVLRDVSGRSLAELADDWRMLREKVKSRRFLPSDYRGATFYLSDLGIFPVVHSFDLDRSDRCISDFVHWFGEA